MSQALIVRDGEIDKRFLDRVIAYAVANRALSLAERARLAKEASDLHQGFCTELGLNYHATLDALHGAKLLHNLISLGLELESGGNIISAIEALRRGGIGFFVKAARARLDALQIQIELFERHVSEAFEFAAAWGSACVVIEYSRTLEVVGELWGISGELTRGLDFRAQLSTAHYRKGAREKLYEEIRTVGVLGTVEQFANYLDLELRVSKTYLPWSELKNHARLEPCNPEGTLLAELDIKWTVATFLSTLAVTARSAGREKNSPTVSWRTLRRFIPQFARVGFRRESVKLLTKYFESRTPAPSAEEMKVLVDLFGGSFDQLIRMGDSKNQDQPADWYDRVHLRVDTREVHRQIQFGLATDNEGRSRRERGHPLELGELGAVAINETSARFVEALARFNWRSLRTDDDLHELVIMSPDHVLASALPLIERFVLFMVARGGWDDWSLRNKQVLIDRLLADWSKAKWRRIKKSVVQDVVEEATAAQAVRLSKIIGTEFYRKKRRGF